MRSVVVFETLAAQPFVCGGFEPLVVEAMADGPEIPGHIVISAWVGMGSDGFDFGMLRVRHLIGVLSITEVQTSSHFRHSCHLSCALDIHLQGKGRSLRRLKRTDVVALTDSYFSNAVC